MRKRIYLTIFLTMMLASFKAFTIESIPTINIPVDTVPAEWQIPEDMTGKKVLVIGATSKNGIDSIGRKIADIYASRGAEVICTCRDPDEHPEFPYTLLKLEFGEKNSFKRFWNRIKAHHWPENSPYHDFDHIHLGIGQVVFTHPLYVPEDELERISRMYFEDPWKFYKNFIEFSDPERKLSITFIGSLAAFNGAAQILQQYESAQRDRLQFIRNFNFWFGPKYYPHLTLQFIGCSFVDTNILNNASIYARDQYVSTAEFYTALGVANAMQPAVAADAHVRAATNGTPNTLRVFHISANIASSNLFYAINTGLNNMDYVNALWENTGLGFGLTRPTYPPDPIPSLNKAQPINSPELVNEKPTNETQEDMSGEMQKTDFNFNGHVGL